MGGDVSQPVQQWSRELKRLDHLRSILQLDTAVQFMGQQTQDKLPYFYNAAEVVVMPSHYESFGMAVLEAMACGVSVITTNVAGISGILDKRHAKLVTTVNNPLLLADQIEHLLDHHSESQRIGREIHQKVQDLDWRFIAQKVARVYRQVGMR